MLAAAVVLAGCGGSHAKPQTRTEVIRSVGTDGGLDALGIYRAEAPGVVTVLSLFDGGDSGEGAGFVLNGEGEIATNAHVIATGDGGALKRARQVFVEFADGNRVQARIVGHDPNADVALLKVDPAGLKLRALPLGESEKLEVGQPVAAIRSPFGQARS